MRRIYSIAGAAVLAIIFVVAVSTYLQANEQRVSMTSDLQYRTRLLADSLEDSVAPSVFYHATSSVQRIADKIADNQRVEGVAIFNTGGGMIAASKSATSTSDQALVANAMDSNQAQTAFERQGGTDRYIYVQPLHGGGNDNKVIGAIAVVQNAKYIDDAVAAIWYENLWRLIIQVLLIGLAFVALVRFVFFQSIGALTRSLQAVRRGDRDALFHIESIFKPLAGEITKFGASLRQAQRAASIEARLRQEKLESPWTADRLKEFMRAFLKDRPIYCISNREPYIHSKNQRGQIDSSVPASGMVTAIEPVMEACGGMWIAHGSGNADSETADKNGYVPVPPDDPKYTLKRIFLTEREVKGHYVGFSNEALWPLCHQAHTRPIFREEDWKEYKRVNGTFAAALLQEIRNVDRPLILVQDFHFALLPAMVKSARPDAMVGIFWHIPWPSPEAFSICPYRREILEGLLGADLIGFHTQQYCNNFMDTVAREVESLIDLEHFRVTKGGHSSSVEPFPISIAFATEGEEHTIDRAPLERLGIHAQKIILGVDRLDYTKGIVERFKGYEYLLETAPQYRGRIAMLQIAPPSREAVEKYRDYNAAVTAEADRINAKYGTQNWRPIVLEKRHHSHPELENLYRIADICLVTSLHDGMNLVAKEFVAARDDEAGVLVLSNFTGASRDLRSALMVNPYSAEEIAKALETALTMSKTEQHRRMKAMRQSVKDYNVYRWSAEFIKALTQLE
jgi:alpha,alpha-trehalose-phosphate synthase [UDP-forming]